MFQEDYTSGVGTSWLLNVAMAENKMILEMISAIEESYAAGRGGCDMNGCKQCPAYAKCTAIYRGSSCAALRSHYGLEDDPEIKTNADHIRAMSDEELIQFQAALIKTLGCPPSNPEVCIDDCKKCWGIYLRQPLEEET
nr:MAG TPA: hypothetical protein [Caudoviricetes sp.]